MRQSSAARPAGPGCAPPALAASGLVTAARNQSSSARRALKTPRGRDPRMISHADLAGRVPPRHQAVPLSAFVSVKPGAAPRPG